MSVTAPFPWFGGKRRVAAEVWAAFGADVPNYIEPFAGSLAVLLARPGGAGKIETVNDRDRYLGNFWRAVAADPDEVARWADWPVNECAPAGTLISTPMGSRPIEEIRSGDVVWGFDGVRVVATRVTATRRSLSHDAFIKLGPLSLTGNHPVWTEDSGYVEVSRLAGGERVRMLEETDADLGDLCAVGPENRRRPLHRRDVPSEGSPKRASVESHPQGLSLSREALAPGVAREVFNFQTETGNYFAERVLVHNCDLHARHKWLVNQVEFRERMHTDPDFYDAKIAGWWVWGLCQWIGGGWCVEPNNRKHPKLDSDGAFDPKRQLPDLAVTCAGSATGRGVHSAQAYSPGRRPNLSGHQGVHLPSLGNDRGLNGVAAAPCVEWFRALQSRLRRVRVACGDWKRVLGNSVLGKGKNVGGRRPCAVFLDPPYSFEFRDPYLYSEDDAAISAQVREWAIEHGDDPDLRIALCGYDGEHEMPPSWRKLAWKAARGYAGEDNENRKLERVWFSPHCLAPAQGSLFDMAGEAAE